MRLQKVFLLFILLFLSSQVLAKSIEMLIAKAPINIEDKHSIERGAKFFASNCMSCHTMIYLRYDSLAEKQGVIYSKMPINVTSWPSGVKPPDLSLEASLRTPNWIYTYLHSFYSDPSRPTGFNNLLVHNTAMPGIIAGFQGQQVLANDLKNNKEIFKDNLEWYDLLTLKSKGSMSAEDFDATITDVVNFLQYAAEPYKLQQLRLGPWVLGFLVIFSILLYFLKKAYWKDLNKTPRYEE